MPLIATASSAIWRCRSVSIRSGQEVVDRDVRGATSRDRPLATEVSPLRAADDSPIGVIGAITIAEVMFTMRPNRRSTIPSITSRISSSAESMLASTAAIQSSRDQSWNRPGGGPPLFVTTMSGDGHAARSAARVASRAMSPTTASPGRRTPRASAAAVASSASRVAPVDRDVHTLTRERRRARAPEPAARRRDDRGPAGDAEVHGCLPHQKSRSGGGWRAPLVERVVIGWFPARRARGEQVRVGPVLHGEPDRVLPVVEHLPAEDVAADAPVVPGARRRRGGRGPPSDRRSRRPPTRSARACSPVSSTSSV